jgi:hypothetical protein
MEQFGQTAYAAGAALDECRKAATIEEQNGCSRDRGVAHAAPSSSLKTRRNGSARTAGDLAHVDDVDVGSAPHPAIRQRQQR